MPDVFLFRFGNGNYHQAALTSLTAFLSVLPLRGGQQADAARTSERLPRLFFTGAGSPSCV
jgi:hypothetical protein